MHSPHSLGLKTSSNNYYNMDLHSKYNKGYLYDYLGIVRCPRPTLRLQCCNDYHHNVHSDPDRAPQGLYRSFVIRQLPSTIQNKADII